MKRKTIKELEAQLATIRELRDGDCHLRNALELKIDDLEARLKLIAGENESLRMDKKWLQSITSGLAQAIHTRS